MPAAPITLAYSVDSDDLFMFYALLEGKIDTGAMSFEHLRHDTKTLNEMARQQQVDITAVSIHAYAYLTEHYLLLPHGGSIGVNYGPLVLANQPGSLDKLAGRKISLPGLDTTAALVFQLACPEFEPVIIPITPFERTFTALRSGDVDAAVVIHEGNLTYAERGFYKILDLGAWWWEQTGYPLPLGGNVIRRGLGMEKINRISQLLRESIRYALEHREEVIEYLLARETRTDRALHNRQLLDCYLSLYANRDTLEFPDAARAGMAELFRRGFQAGLIPQPVKIEFAP
ncbi:MAG: ABC transporter substrate-binding protein [Deltaproteobacteria bacterium]|nr:ABC transporter substrate-binding protein [Candidatus Anaeroferrophillus wilburensis]MBN2888183.1 ABC transporter substrate-binding protein [Deltaproteobacteria bacterium]